MSPLRLFPITVLLATVLLAAVLLPTVLTGLCPGQSAGQSALLWQIGTADDNTAELALGPKDYADYAGDPLFVVGRSVPKQDWPYVQPGPGDAWAEGRQHDSSIVFTLKQKPTAACRLEVDLVDTHDRSPAKLAILVNHRNVTEHQTPQGGPDDSIFGDPTKGKEHRFTVDIPADDLLAGTNDVTIRTLSGSWVLYDWVGFTAPAGTELALAPTATVVHAIQSAPVLVEREGKLMQTVQMTVRHFGEPGKATVEIGDRPPVEIDLVSGANAVEVPIPAVEKETTVTVAVKVGAKTIARGEVVVQPVRKWVIYVLPHSHVDIGYTQLQTTVEQDHWRYYEQAIEASRRTADYPDGAQFKWNTEVLWATDSYLRQATPEKQQEFVDAVRKGWIGLDALYGNELTALCRPEELVRLVDYAAQVSRRCGVPIESAMISDVPGYTWGLTTVLADAGVKYFSIGPNGGHRIGYTLKQWGDKAFYWVTPSGNQKVLCWIPRTGYYRAFTTPEQVMNLVRQTADRDYPYDLIQVRYCLGDNAGPGVELSELAKEWNTRYAYPKLVIATVPEMMRDFEKRYGQDLPEVRGDFTPYWEDGAGSSARETGLNRAAAERLTQAEALWAILSPQTYPAADFYAAWRSAILYDEHTWGAHNSISQPDSEFAKGQWAIKQAFALDADKQSHKLLASAVAPVAKAKASVDTLMVFNTANWPRTDLVILPKEAVTSGDAVRGPDGQPVASQRLSTGQLAFLASDVPPLGAKRFTLAATGPAATGKGKAAGTTLSNGALVVTLDEETGAIASLNARGLQSNLVDNAGGLGLNAYRYVAGRDPKDPQPSGAVKITVKEPGPLVASLRIESEAPGCWRLVRELRMVDGLDHVDLLNVVDKEKTRTPESVHFGFAFNVPEGVMRMNTPLAVVRPEEDQLPGACKNYFTVGRWVDVSNKAYGVTWATIDAPLVEVGEIRVDVRPDFSPDNWVKHLDPSQTLYSYVMNNYWETNYKADQEGPTPFRYALRPHVEPYDPIASARFGIERSQPLVAVPADANAPAEIASRLRLDSDAVIVQSFKPSRDGKAWIVRLFGASGRPSNVALTWADPQPAAVSVSNFAEEQGKQLTGAIEVSAYGLVTLRAELPQ
ncbi:MAG: hypothetical protein A2V70_14855 [Planctomycetes bacterium RBG_13_63_9]|nr:MAG: hypothetical protein A2V70_14855 [Planctomycetes bacterium RBG_13_63_9]